VHVGYGLYLYAMTHKQKCSRCGTNPASRTIRECIADPQLGSAVKEHLARTYFNQLCQSCLDETGRIVEQAVNHPVIGVKKLKEGIHYYQEGPYLVFTEVYHVAKGYCCQNLCRHCAYGYRQSKKTRMQ